MQKGIEYLAQLGRPDGSLSFYLNQPLGVKVKAKARIGCHETVTQRDLTSIIG